MKNNKSYTKEKAITLIALVITIIVLLILAGVTVGMVVGENGIISKTTLAKNKTKIADIKEAVGLAILENNIAKNNQSNALKTKEDIVAELFNKGKITTEEKSFLENQDYIEVDGERIDFSALPKQNPYLYEPAFLDEQNLVPNVEKSLSEYGMYYDAPYSAQINDDLKISIVFDSDQTIEVYKNNIGFDFYSDQNYDDYFEEITVEGENKIIVPGSIMNNLTAGEVTNDTELAFSNEEYNHAFTNVRYYIMDCYTDYEDMVIDDNRKLYNWKLFEDAPSSYAPFFHGNSSIPVLDKCVYKGYSHYRASMDGKNIYHQYEETLFWTCNSFEYPRILPCSDAVAGKERAIEGNPDNATYIIYKYFWYAYDNNYEGYVTAVLDNSITTNRAMKNDIYGVTVNTLKSFANCNSLEEVIISSNITNICREAFSGCTKLTEITYEGTINQWNSIQKDANWTTGSVIETIHCSDGDISL